MQEPSEKVQSASIEEFRQFCSCDKIKWTTHGLERLQERDISVDDVKRCLMNGEIIEEYPDDFPKPSALIFGYRAIGNPLHVVCGINHECIYIVTAYVPTEEKFEPDLKTRRRKKNVHVLQM